VLPTTTDSSPLTSIADASDDAIFGITLDGTITAWNRAAERIYGYAADEIVGTSAVRFLPPGGTNDLPALLEKVGRGETVRRYETVHYTRDARLVRVELSLAPLAGSDGEVAGAAAVAREAGEVQDYAETQRTARQRFREILDLAPIALLIIDERGRIEFANPGAAQLFGYDRYELLALDLTTLLPDRIAGHSPRGDVSDLAATPDAVGRRRDGTEFPVELGVNTVVQNGRRVLAVAIADLSARRAAEEDLLDVARQQAAIADLGHRALEGVDLATLLDEAVRLVARVLDMPLACVLELDAARGALVQRAAVGWRPLRPGRERLHLADAPPAASALRASDPVAVADFRADGAFTLSPLLHDHDIVSGLAAVIHGRDEAYGVLAAYAREPRVMSRHDLTFVRGIANVLAAAIERRRSDERLRSTEEQLVQAQKMESVGRLAGGVAHDFNNLLTGIFGYTSLLQGELRQGDGEARELVRGIQDSAEKAAALTAQLLAFSRRQVLQPRVVDVNDIVRGIEPLLHRVIGETVSLVTLPRAQIGRVRADPTQLEQIVMNLVVNARDAMPDGGTVVVETDEVAFDEAYAQEHFDVSPGRYVMLAVTDSGLGMDADTRMHLFEPFFTTKGPGKGTGLGLATTYGIVKQSGGHIWLYSEPGRGSTFKIYLPRVTAPSDEVAPPLQRPPGSSRGETVLLVEDESSVRDITRAVLMRHGYRVLVAENGQAALAVADAHPGRIDLLVTDVVMPGLGGRALAEQLQVRRPEVRTLYVSGYTEDAVVRRGVLESNVAFLAKPFSPDALARSVRDVLQGPLPSAGGHGRIAEPHARR
jgi:PAS domain S-box-containing protein